MTAPRHRHTGAYVPHLPCLLLLALIAILLNVKHLNEPPAYIHAWAQADNYSLALGFLHNGGDLWHPQTMIFNKQQFDTTATAYSTVTACDLPLHHWCAAMLMRLLGTTQPWVFRGWTLAVVIAGLWALYALVYLMTRSRLKALLLAAVCTTAPSFAYYSASFLPTAPALSCAFAGLMAYALHTRRKSDGWLYVSLLMLTLAMLQRTSMAVLWVAVAGFHFLRLLRRETSLRRTWLPFALGAVAFAAYYVWNMHLRRDYGSLFLASLMPVDSVDHARNVFQNVHDRWQFHYFQRLQHWLAVALLLAAIVCRLLGIRQSAQPKGLSPWWLLAIYAFGEILFGIAMLAQYKDHDYYFLDSFFLPMLLLMALLLGMLPNTTRQWSRWLSAAAVAALVVPMTLQACRMQDERRKEGTEALATAVNYKSANRLLESAGYGSADTRLLALFAYPQNTPFCMMDRQGYVVMWNDTAVVNHALTFPYDIIVVEDDVYRRDFDEAGYILGRLQRIGGNDTLSLCRLADSTLHTTADHFFSPIDQ